MPHTDSTVADVAVKPPAEPPRAQHPFCAKKSGRGNCCEAAEAEREAVKFFELRPEVFSFIADDKMNRWDLDVKRLLTDVEADEDSDEAFKDRLYGFLRLKA